MPPLKKTCKLPNGETVELFYIGTLAKALGRTTNLVRKWEISGTIPDPCFRDKFNCRLYTQEQIDIIVKCAEEAKIKQGAQIMKTSFSKRLYKEFEKINDLFFKAPEGEDKNRKVKK